MNRGRAFPHADHTPQAMTFHPLTRRHFLHTTGTALALPLLESPSRAADVPQTLAELWAGFEPRKDPLEIEVLKEWEQDGVVCRLIRSASLRS